MIRSNTSVATEHDSDLSVWPVDRLAAHLQSRAGEYYPELQGRRTRAVLVRRLQRSNSQLFDFQLESGERMYPVIVKFPFSANEGRRRERRLVADRPRLFPKVDPVESGIYEYRVLEAISRAFDHATDPRFDVIRPLDFIEGPNALVMERCNHPSLRQKLLRANRLQRPFAAPQWNESMRRAGAWLKNFHGLESLEHTTTRTSTPAEFCDALARFCEFLERHSRFTKYVRRVNDRLFKLAAEILPDELPLGLIHGDYAPRNILVAADQTITVFDTGAEWRCPIYEDLAHFLIAIKASGPQLCSLGLLYNTQVIAVYERDFLEGYFAGGPVPLSAIRLFECLLALEWWAAIVFRHHEASGLRRAVKGTRAVVWSRFIRQYVDRMLADLTLLEAARGAETT